MSSHERIAKICNINLDHSNQFKVVEKFVPKSKSSALGVCFASREKLDLLGTHWVPPPDDKYVSLYYIFVN